MNRACTVSGTCTKIAASSATAKIAISSHANAGTNHFGGSCGRSGALSSHVVMSDSDLPARQIEVQTARGHQLVVRPLLDDRSFFENDDLVRVADRAQAMRDHDRAPAAHQPRHVLLNRALRFRIER